ncbi:hypothetical protein NDU88_002797 [Pleurodeles waltl]|uniref:Uncharacterized protein n=1 Tax=Pleurodeles waltl TaxID=8319 RepID=A0AAV7P7Z9_PLEWA|nr:hypothetical protein NDU88_002797 [Pleurodeles waltl]
MPRLKAARKEALGAAPRDNMVLESALLFGFTNGVPTTAMGGRDTRKWNYAHNPHFWRRLDYYRKLTRGVFSENTLKEPAPQPGGGGLVGADSCAMVRRKEKDPPISQECPPAQQHATTTQGEDLSNIKPARDIVAVQNILQSPGGRDKENEKEMKILDWAKDSGDKFYSLTEESDFSSADEHSPSESGSSMSSERGNASSSNELTVRQRWRQRKLTKIRSESQECTEFSASSGSKTLKWDYSSISLMDITRTADTSAMGGQQVVNNDMEENNGGRKSDICTASTDSGMLQSIFNSIKEFQTETRIESR